jgi:hypothetical protein
MIKAELKNGKTEDIIIPIGSNLKKDEEYIHEFTINKEGIYYLYLKAGKTAKGITNPEFIFTINQGIPHEDYPVTSIKLSDKSEWIRCNTVSSSLSRSPAHRLFMDEGKNQLIIRGIDAFFLEEILISSNPFKVLD